MANIFQYTSGAGGIGGFGNFDAFDLGIGAGAGSFQSGAQQATYQMAAALKRTAAILKSKGLTTPAKDITAVESTFYTSSSPTSQGQAQPAPLVLPLLHPSLPAKSIAYRNLTSPAPVIPASVTGKSGNSFLIGLAVVIGWIILR